MDLKHRSRGITDGRDRAPARAMFKAIGFTDNDLSKPLIGVANTWIETMPCNFHLRRLSAKVKEGIRAAGGTPMEFNTIAISDGETMGTEGMRASLISREVIADSIELVCRGQLFDAVVCVVGCDKTIPAAAMALARLDLPGIVLYGGTIAAGNHRGKDITIQDVFEAVGANAAGKLSEDRKSTRLNSSHVSISYAVYTLALHSFPTRRSSDLFDAVVCVVGCDKTIPAAAMALARLDLPGIVLYGGTIAAGNHRGKDITIQDVFEAVGANAAGKLSDSDLLEMENVACPGAGACGGQYTANTMSTVMELIGLSPMGFNGIPAMDPRKDEIAFRCGDVALNLLR